jgi:hypothetical protein
VIISRACQDFNTSCLSASRRQQVTYFNSSEEEEEVFVIVDAEEYSSGDSVFELDLALVDLSAPSAGETCGDTITLETGAYDGNTASYHDLASNLHATCCEHPCVGFGVALLGPDVFHQVSVPAGQTLTATLMAQSTELSMWLALDCDAIGTTCTELLWVEAGGQGQLSYSNTGQAPLDVFLIVDSDDVTNAGAYRIIVDLAS